MGIKFICPACGGALNVKSELAGKRGRCPKCQAKINIPPESAAGDSVAGAPAADAGGLATAAPPAGPTENSTKAAPIGVVAVAPLMSAAQQPAAVAMPAAIVAGGVADPIAEAPALQWYATPPGAASQYGPASGEEFRAWMREGRITADALVWRQDWPDWKRAGEVFPQLESPPATGGPPVVATPAVAAPAIAGPAVAAPIIAAPVIAAGAMPLPTAPTAMPMMPGVPPTAQPAFPMASGPFPAAVPAQGDAFPIAADEPAAKRSGAGRGRAYRARSNTGPIVAIVVLLVAMIPLSYFVWKVVHDQISSPPAETATGPEKTKQ